MQLIRQVRMPECQPPQNANPNSRQSTREQAQEATNDAAKDKAKLIASKVDGYDFRLPSNQAEILGWTVTDLTDEQKS